MLIQKSSRISDLQQVFSKKFPGLKIEFYKKGHSDYEGSLKDLEYDADQLIGELQPDLVEGQINSDPSMSVAEFENEFATRFGLNVQVFRRSNAIWLQTVKTDDWTLEIQNAKGLRSIQTN